MATLTCPSCSKKLRLPDDAMGRRIKCPACGTAFTATEGAEKVKPTSAAKPVRATAPHEENDEEISAAKPAKTARRPPPPEVDPEDEVEDRPRKKARGPAEDREEDDEDDRPRQRGKKKKEQPKQNLGTTVAGFSVPFLGAIAGVIVVFMTWKEGASYERLLGPLFMGIGLFMMMAAILNWDWFMQFWSSYSAQMLGPIGLRIMYVMLGLLIVAMGVLGAMGVIDLRTKN